MLPWMEFLWNNYYLRNYKVYHILRNLWFWSKIMLTLIGDVWWRIGLHMLTMRTWLFIVIRLFSQSVFPVTPVWSTGHPPHTATELCPSLPTSPCSSSDLRLWPPFELISSRWYSVVPSSWTLCGFHSRAVRFTSAWGFRNVCPYRLHFLRFISFSTGTWAVPHRSWLLIVSGHPTWRILRRHRFIVRLLQVININFLIKIRFSCKYKVDIVTLQTLFYKNKF
jgi:hypothetical protein